MKLSESAFIKNYQHHHGHTFHLKADYEPESTLGIFIPFSDDILIPSQTFWRKLFNMGFTRLYYFYVFTLVGDYQKLTVASSEKLSNQEKMEYYLGQYCPYITEIYFPDLHFSDHGFNELYQSKVKELKSVIKNVNQNIRIRPLIELIGSNDYMDMFDLSKSSLDYIEDSV